MRQPAYAFTKVSRTAYCLVSGELRLPHFFDETPEVFLVHAHLAQQVNTWQYAEYGPTYKNDPLRLAE